MILIKTLTSKAQIMALFLSLYVVCQSAVSGPLAIADRSSFSRLQGLPIPLQGHVLAHKEFKQQVSFALSSQFATDRASNEYVLVDSELAELHYYARYGLTERLELTLDLPYLSQSGGVFDQSIEQFHSLFGMPNGGRHQLPQNQLRYELRADDTIFEYRQNSSGLTDIGIGARYQLFSHSEQALAMALRVDLPTGDFAEMTGSDSTDIALGFDYSDKLLLEPWGVSTHASIGFLWFGDSKVLPKLSNRESVYASLSLERPLFGVDAILQLQGQTPMFDIDLVPFTSPVLQASFALSVPISNLELEVGFSEDLITETSPDITVFINLRGR